MLDDFGVVVEQADDLGVGGFDGPVVDGGVVEGVGVVEDADLGVMGELLEIAAGGFVG